MIDYLAWRSANGPTAASRTAKAQLRATDTLERLNDKFEPPTMIVFTKPRRVDGDGTVTEETDLDPQLVRLEVDNRASPISGVAGVGPEMNLIIFALPDADIDEGYTFSLNDDSYRITDIIVQVGEIQAIAVANG